MEEGSGVWNKFENALKKEVGIKYLKFGFPGTKVILLVFEFLMVVHHWPIEAMVTYHHSSQ